MIIVAILSFGIYSATRPSPPPMPDPFTISNIQIRGNYSGTTVTGIANNNSRLTISGGQYSIVFYDVQKAIMDTCLFSIIQPAPPLQSVEFTAYCDTKDYNAVSYEIKYLWAS